MPSLTRNAKRPNRLARIRLIEFLRTFESEIPHSQAYETSGMRDANGNNTGDSFPWKTEQALKYNTPTLGPSKTNCQSGKKT